MELDDTLRALNPKEREVTYAKWQQIIEMSRLDLFIVSSELGESLLVFCLTSNCQCQMMNIKTLLLGNSSCHK